jgi:hypothetical protein
MWIATKNSPEPPVDEAGRPPERRNEARHSTERTNSASKPRAGTESHLPDLLARLDAGAHGALTSQEIESYLESRHRNAGSLVAAYRLSGDEEYLKEAMEKYPNDPQVLFTSLRLTDDPAKRLEILERFKLASPENGMGNSLAAIALFELGRGGEAVEELLRASGKPIRDFALADAQNTEEAFLSAGHRPLEAKLTAFCSLTSPELMNIAKVRTHLEKLREDYQSIGDVQSVDGLRGIQIDIAGKLQQGGFAVERLVGIALEKSALNGLNSPEAEARLVELEVVKDRMTAASLKITQSLMKNPAIPAAEWNLYFDRVKAFGETSANDWMLERFPDL